MTFGFINEVQRLIRDHLFGISGGGAGLELAAVGESIALPPSQLFLASESGESIALPPS
jgi:hypothetical protein